MVNRVELGSAGSILLKWGHKEQLNALWAWARKREALSDQSLPPWKLNKLHNHTPKTLIHLFVVKPRSQFVASYARGCALLDCGAKAKARLPPQPSTLISPTVQGTKLREPRSSNQQHHHKGPSFHPWLTPSHASNLPALRPTPQTTQPYQSDHGGALAKPELVEYGGHQPQQH